MTTYIKNTSQEGRIPWNKGLKTPDSVREKQRMSKLKNPTKYWLGKKRNMTEEWKKHMARNPWNKGKKIPEMSGINHFAWKGTTPLKESIRKCFEYRQWRSDIFTRDDFTCQFCGNRGSIIAHHILSFNDIFEKNNIKTIEDAMNCEEFWNINNGITLCIDCHKKLHKKLGRKNNE